ncbi:hypothetical protein DFH08DRAFT_894443 [Mycena albidolilacea]|uniref:Mucoidy inhibitor A n=1 Tax=Mycena albidolilacea TaxID=1033008 RepID=A0AAD6ZBC0_9AGAR|nr:hypothetical protein DFH08DRAFT_894443 [Mycena albidolilacea]
MTNADPPAFEPTSIELQSVADSKIASVSVYPTRAEVTRVYKFAVHTGQNQVYISGLPNVLEPESLQVEGRGAATIHDVTLSMEDERVPKSSAKLEELLTTREDRGDALARCEQALSSLRQYLGSLTVQNLPVTQLESVLHQYETTGARLDARKKELTRELQRIGAEIAAERAQIAIPPEHNRLRNKAAIGVFAQTPGNVEIALIYAVPHASWTAFYDIRVDMDTKESPVELIYKAAIKQNTGESWDNVPLQLETSTPTFGLGVPKLSPWNLDIYRPFPFAPTAPAAQVAPTRRSWYNPPEGRRSRSSSSASARSRRRRSRSRSPEVVVMKHEEAAVMSTGNVNATFRVPGLVTIPCDGAAHNFTIVELRPQAVMSWVAVPKREAKTHLTAHITNASEYTLLSGTANVYVDGSFIARSTVPSVSPQESFDCPLGLDPSIRITYPPISKQLSQSGFYKKSATHGFTQRIMVHNTKSVPVDGLRIVDQIPASRNAQVKVKLVQPALPLGEGDAAGKGAAGAESNVGAETKGKKSASVSVSKGVVAQWDGGDDTERRVGWVCAVPAQGKINLTLEWTVTVSPADAHVVGL